jgi:hypothetical protein
MLLCAQIAQADDATNALPVVAPKVKTMAVFKNGLAFVFKTGETPLKDGWARMDQLPPAALGSLWLGTTSPSSPVTDVIAFKEKTSADADSVSLAELLAANPGRRVSITYLSGANPKTAIGLLLPSPAAHKPDENEIPPVASPEFRPNWPPNPDSAAPEIVLLRTTMPGGAETSLLALNLNSIQSVEIEGEADLHTKIEREMGRSKFHVAGNPAKAEITIAGLEKGIVWSPSYRINLADDKIAAIELEAVLADDQEDLENADVSFVVGYPNFMFADILSPISLRQSVAGFLQSLMSGSNDRNRAGAFANSMAQAVGYNAPNFGAAQDAGYSVTTAMPGEHNEDLYLYHKNGVTLKKGDRARYSILSTTAPYEHLYQWDVADTMESEQPGYRENESTKKEDLVWHVLRLKNTGKQPWTTAPAFTINDALPVAQDTLNYTPPGGSNTLKLTAATDVRAEQSQTESGRRQIEVARRQYDEVTVDGKLQVSNWKDKEITICVRKSLLGEVLDSPDGKATKVAHNLTAANSTSEISWEFKLPAGQSRDLTYRYKVLLNR